MSESKSTPGPWFIHDCGMERFFKQNQRWLVSAEGRPVASVEGIGDVPEANARLLSAVPSLIEALKKIVSEWDRQKSLFPDLTKDGWMELAITEAKSTLAAATGEHQ